jgi:hypothetical protein
MNISRKYGIRYKKRGVATEKIGLAVIKIK